MKATKKLLALILAVCMLIGMPLSINVGAADGESPTIVRVSVAKDGNWSGVCVEFSEPMTFQSKTISLGIGVMQDGKLISTTNMQLAGWRDQGTGTLWTVKVYDSTNTYASIPEYMKGEYTEARKAAGAKLVFFISDKDADKAIDGKISGFVAQDNGEYLTNTTPGFVDPFQNKEAVAVEISTDYTPVAYWGDDKNLIVETGGLPGVGWVGATVLRAYDKDNNVITLADDMPAEWKFTHVVNLTKTYSSGDKPFHAVLNLNTSANYFKESTYSAIVDRLDKEAPEGYHLVLINQEAAGDGVIESLSKYNYDKNKFIEAVFPDPEYSTAEYERVVIPFGEMVTVENVDVYDNGQVFISFSHDIDVDKLLATTANEKDFFLTISPSGSDSYVKGEDGTNPLSQAWISNIRRSGDSNNTIVGTIAAGTLKNMLNIYNADNGASGWAIRMRIEMAHNYVDKTGMLPLNNNIVALEDGVRSPYMQNRWVGQTWVDVNLVTAEDNTVMVGGELKDLSVISNMDSGEVMLMADATVDALEVLNVKPGVTLDLNGKTLTLADNAGLYVTGILADATDGNGLIKFNKNQVMNPIQLRGDNPQMPLYDTESGGYRLFKKEFTTPGYRQGTLDDPTDTNIMRYGVHLHFNNAKAFELLEQEGTDLVLMAKIYTDDKEIDVEYTFTASTLKKYGQQCKEVAGDAAALQAKTIVLTISGMDLLEGEVLRVDVALMAMGETQMGFAQIVK